MSPREHRERRRRAARPWRARLAALGALGVLGAAMLAPVALLEVGASRARACFAGYTEPRGPELPDCQPTLRWFSLPARVPWTQMQAELYIEEFTARAALASYTDAMVGTASRERAARAASALEESASRIAQGSHRLVLEGLGQAVGAPDPGREAMLLGDRKTLIERYERWGDWNIRLRALEAALLEADLDQAKKIASRYAEFDPRDEDLRSAVGAMLCLAGDAKRGIELLTLVQNDRAEHLHEGWGRNWGEVRAVIVACAARACVAPPPLPEREVAGEGDALEVRTALRLRLSAKEGVAEEETHAAAQSVIDLLDSGPRSPGVRVRLVASLLALGDTLSPSEIARLVSPRTNAGESPLLTLHAQTTLDWLMEANAMRPVVSARALASASQTLEGLASSPELSDDERNALDAAAAASAIEAARIYAAAGKAKQADEILSASSSRALPERARELARSSAYHLAGEHERALAALDRGEVCVGNAAGPLRAAALIQRAEILAAMGRQEEAGRASVLAEEAASAANDRSLLTRARWTRAAFDRVARTPQPTVTVTATTTTRTTTGDRPDKPGASAIPWVGILGTRRSWLSSDAEQATPVSRALAFFTQARATSAENKRALRYVAFAHRGDMPHAAVPYLTLASELLPEGSGDRELWLDAFSAFESRVLPLRSYAWIRAEVARVHGDRPAAAAWTNRRMRLSEIASDPDTAEMAQYLGL